MALPHLATPAASSSTVCVVDTDAALIERLGALFSALGATVRGYGSGRAFLADVGTETPVCVICELRLPDMAGIEVLTALRERGITSPVILLAEGSDVATAVTAMRAGALDFVEKPQVDRLLAWHVHRLLEGAGTLRE
jgi:two-component system, LuxR family, response regulator FixJ